MKKFNILLAVALLSGAQLTHAIVLPQPKKLESTVVKKPAQTCFIQIPNLVQAVHINVGYLLSIETRSNSNQLAVIMAGQQTPYRFIYKDAKAAKESMDKILELANSGDC